MHFVNDAITTATSWLTTTTTQTLAATTQHTPAPTCTITDSIETHCFAAVTASSPANGTQIITTNCRTDCPAGLPGWKQLVIPLIAILSVTRAQQIMDEYHNSERGYMRNWLRRVFGLGENVYLEAPRAIKQHSKKCLADKNS